ncbi:MAG: membrane protein insertion efficiency factor YidD [Candidatus Neomarinimicrobiota bacterium]
MSKQATRQALINLLTLLIRVYQNTFSLLFPPSCRYTPSCSQYAIDAISKYGVASGLYRAGKRILRCHPFTSHNSYDPA